MSESGHLGIQSFEARYRLLLFLTVITLVFSITLNTVFAALLFLNTFTAPRRAYQNFDKKNILFWLYLALFAVYLASIFYSDLHQTAFIKIQTKLGLILLPFAITAGIYSADMRFKKLLVKGFIISVSLSALFCIGYAFYKFFYYDGWYRYWQDGSIRDHHFFYTGISDPMMHAGYFSLYTGIAIFLAAYVYQITRSKGWIYLIIPFLIVFLFLLQGRMNLIAFALTAIGYITYLFIRNRRYKLMAAIILPAAVLLFLSIRFLPGAATKRLTEAFNPKYDITSSSFEDFSGLALRLAEWSCAWTVIEENWITGVGIGDSKAELVESYKAHQFTLGIERQFNCHNQFLETWLATGIPGFILLLGIGMEYLRLAWKRKEPVLALIILYFFLSMITESMLERHWAISIFSSLLFFLTVNRTAPGKEIP